MHPNKLHIKFFQYNHVLLGYFALIIIHSHASKQVKLQASHIKNENEPSWGHQILSGCDFELKLQVTAKLTNVQEKYIKSWCEMDMIEKRQHAPQKLYNKKVKSWQSM